jgi:regulator of sigma E protease
MIANIFYLLLAIFGLGFLVFVHELGHYLVARRVKMKVEVFSIGFGPTLYQWTFHDVQWKLCAFPFGGYVKIAEMEKQHPTDGFPPENSKSFYKNTPINRIKVAFAGPLSNIIFAFLAFSTIWISGGQKKPFQQHTNIIGYIDPQSALYAAGIRAGDEIVSVNNRPTHGYKDLFSSLLMKKESVRIDGNIVNYFLKKKEAFSITIPIYKNSVIDEDPLGIFPAQYLMFKDISSTNAPIANSGIKKNDRIVWVNGHLIFSQPQLSSILNDPKILLTIKRGDKQFLTQVPQVKISYLRLQPHQKDDMEDWKHAAGIQSKITQLYFIPYEINHCGYIEKSLSFMNDNIEEVLPSMQFRNPFSLLLRPKDQIVAVNGTPVTNAIEFLAAVQKQQAVVIVQRKNKQAIASWKNSDELFEQSFDISPLKTITATIGTRNTIYQNEGLILLPTITLKSYGELNLNTENSLREARIKKQINEITNPQQKEQQLRLLEKRKSQLLLGAQLQDQLISFNPKPTNLFSFAFNQTWQPLVGLFSGSLHPKHLSSPIGIIQILQQSWSSSCKDAIFWLGFISLNLAILNLLPLPILDGGLILFAIIETITKKPIKPKVMEKIILPFIGLLVLLFVYVSYQDIVRLVKHFF